MTLSPSSDKRPTAPRSGLELLRWVIFEPLRLGSYSKQLNRWQAIGWFLRAAPWIALLTVLLWLLVVLVVVGLDMPAFLPELFSWEVIQAWGHLGSLTDRLGFGWWMQHFAEGLAFALAVGLAVGLPLVLAFGLAAGLAWGLTVGSSVGLAVGQTWGLAWGLVVGSSVGQVVGMAKSQVWGPAAGLGVGMGLGLAVSQNLGLGVGLAEILSIYVVYFRLLPFYLLYQPVFLWVGDLAFNPYRWDEVIWLPIWGLEGRLLRQAFEQPEQAQAFIDFLLEHRPLQRRLAQRLIHAATAGDWRHHLLRNGYPRAPRLVEQQPRLHPSAAWLGQVERARVQLANALTQSNLTLKIEAMARLQDELAELRAQTLHEAPDWSLVYLPALDVWREQAGQELLRLEGDRQHYQPILTNPYQAGEILQPERNEPVFIDRPAVREQLARAVLSAQSMPLFLLQGQRRVGKSSLLAFLATLLGAGFKVVLQDCQQGFPRGIPDWLGDLRRRIDQSLGLSPADWTAPEPWVSAWTEFRRYLEQLPPLVRGEYKLILALDEYESLQRHLQRDPTQAEELLGAMRSFTQSQNRVVLLFAGAARLSELQHPHWGRYFVQTQWLPLDYLSREESRRLITEPVVPALDYEPEVVERLWSLTQGQPALLQLLCRRLVDIANRDAKGRLGQAELDEALGAIDRETHAIAVFWEEFCDPQRYPGCRDAVWQILRQQPVTDRASLQRLQEHGYILADGEGWRLRVPLFEHWIRDYGHC